MNPRKVLITADVHIHKHKNMDTLDPKSKRLEDGLKFLQWFVDYGRDNADLVVIAGDLFHTRKKMDMEVFAGVTAILKNASVPIVLLAGNHDQYTEEITSLDSIASKPNKIYKTLSVVTKALSCSFNDFSLHFSPFRELPKDFEQDLQSLGEEFHPNRTYLITHNSMNDAVVGTFEYRPKSNITLDMLDQRYSHTFAGHYHRPQTIGERFTYVGSPMHLDRSDKDQEKSVVLLDGCTGEWERIVYEGYPKFLTVDWEDVLGDESGSYEGHFLDVRVKDSTDPETIREVLMNYGVRNYKPIFSKKKAVPSSEEDSSSNWEEMSTDEVIVTYANNNPIEEVSTKDCIEYGMSLIHLAQQSR